MDMLNMRRNGGLVDAAADDHGIRIKYPEIACTNFGCPHSPRGQVRPTGRKSAVDRHNRVVKPAPLKEACLNNAVENVALRRIDQEGKLDRPEGDLYVAEGHA
jgi:hypothetical protein